MDHIFIISGPAGSGKDTVIDGLRKILSFDRVITSTTREPRPGESEGNPYFFLTRENFETGIKEERFIEHSINENNEHYGVERREIERINKQGGLTLWKLDWKGVQNVKKIYPLIPSILITAPLPVLEARLRKRDTDKDEAYFRERMAYTKEWMRHIDIYDYIVENEDGKIDEAIEKVRAIIENHPKKSQA